MQVIRRHFQDLAYVQINGEKTCQQQLVVRTDSKDDRQLLMVSNLFPPGRSAVNFQNVKDYLACLLCQIVFRLSVIRISVFFLLLFKERSWWFKTNDNVH